MKKFFYTILLFSALLAQKVQAQGFLDDSSISTECRTSGTCSLDDVAAGFISLTRMLLGAIAAIALVFLVWGGVQWVWSGGNADKVKRGKDIVFHTMAALTLAFGSFMITSFFINDILDVDGRYKIGDGSVGTVEECVNKDLGSQCGLPEINMVCTGPDIGSGDECLEKCIITNYIYANQLNAERLAFRCSTELPIADRTYAGGLCPGDENNVCRLFAQIAGEQKIVTEQMALDDIYYQDMIDAAKSYWAQN